MNTVMTVSTALVVEGIRDMIVTGRKITEETDDVVYPDTLLKVFISCRSFLVKFLGLLI